MGSNGKRVPFNNFSFKYANKTKKFRQQSTLLHSTSKYAKEKVLASNLASSC